MTVTLEPPSEVIWATRLPLPEAEEVDVAVSLRLMGPFSNSDRSDALVSVTEVEPVAIWLPKSWPLLPPKSSEPS